MWVLFYRDLWVPVWPNLVASALWAPGALWWHHSRLRQHVTDEVERIRDELADTQPEQGDSP